MALEGAVVTPATKGEPQRLCRERREAGGGGRPTASDSGLGRTETGAGAGQPRAAPNLAHWVISPAKQAGQTHLSPKLPFP